MPELKRNLKVAGQGRDELYALVVRDLGKLLDEAKIAGYSIRCDESSKCVYVEAKHVKAVLACHEGELHLDAQLSWMAAAFKGVLENKLDAWMRKTFG